MTKVEEVHHILPLSRGGTNDEDNLMSLCKSCHSKIHAKSGDRWNGIVKKPIPSYPGYYADEYGNIYSMRSGVEIKISQRIHKDYLHVTVRDNNSPVRRHKEPVHKLVLQAFKGYRPDNYVCKHLNGDRLDNRVVNLEWGTQQENIMDSIRHGTAACLRHGESSNGSKLKLIDILKIRWLSKFGYRQNELAIWFNISQRMYRI